MADQKRGSSGDLEIELKEKDASGAKVYPMDDYTPDSGPEVAFLNGGKSGDNSIELNERKRNYEPVGMKKEELMKYADDPFWKRVRLILVILIVAGWLALLVAAIIIIVLAPRCPPRPDLKWWQKSVFYQVESRSFMDSNGDGIGDLKGVQQKIPYLKKLGVDVVIMGPIFPSEGAALGFDVTDFTTVSPQYGTMADFKELKKAMKSSGMKLILDFIPNHTGKGHQWFQSSSGGVDGFADYYIWAEGTSPPNDLKNVYGDPAWTYDAQRKAYYYHTFSADEPDLNLTNKAVVWALNDTLLQWLKKGADGFVIRNAEHLVELPMTRVGTDGSISEGSYQLFSIWREILDKYSNDDGFAKSQAYDRLLIADVAASPEQTAHFVSFHDDAGELKAGAQMATVKSLAGTKSGCDVQCLEFQIRNFVTLGNNSAYWMNWQMGNFKTNRVATRFGSKMVNAFNMMLLTLPGRAFAYYGEEIGIEDSEFTDSSSGFWNSSLKLTKDQLKRSVMRAPMLWREDMYAGFTNTTPWLPLAKIFKESNVEFQTAYGAGHSQIDIFAEMTKLRKEPSFQWGDFKLKTRDSVLYYMRKAEGFDGYLVAINFGPNPSVVELQTSKPFGDEVTDKGVIVATTGAFEGEGRASSYKMGMELDMKNFYLLPSEGVIFKMVPPAE